jgi:hypothetical protein
MNVLIKGIGGDRYRPMAGVSRGKAANGAALLLALPVWIVM